MRQIGLLQALVQTKLADRMTGEGRRKLQMRRFRRLVAHVRKNSPYFQEKFAGIPEDAPLSAYPVTTKKDLMANFDRWMTDSCVTRQEIDDFMSDLHNVGRKFKGKYLVYTTSGSTGNPCIALYDDSATNVNAAVGFDRSFSRKEDLQKFMKSGGKTMALFADNGFYLASGSVRYQLRKMPWKKKQMKTFEVRKPMPEIVKALNDFQPSMLGCYPSALQLIAAEQEAGRLNIHPAIIMTGGEHLDDSVRDYLERVFGCCVQTNYSCTEGGTVACECTEKHFHINEDWVILEAVDQNNQPVPFGTQSAKVLLTNLSNFICPFIRFGITDRVVMHNTLCGCGKEGPWLTLEGRTDDILTFPGNIRIAPLSLYAELKEIPSISRFQLIQQEDDRLELRLVCEDQEVQFRQAQARLTDYLGSFGIDSEIYLSEKLPETNSVSGKFQHIIEKRYKNPAAENSAAGLYILHFITYRHSGRPSAAQYRQPVC